MNRAAKAARWTARMLSVPVILIWAFFIVAYAVGPVRSLPAGPLETVAYVAMIVSILGLAVSWRWELCGSVVTLVAVAVGAGYNWQGLLSPAMVGPINAALFLLSWWLNRSATRK